MARAEAAEVADTGFTLDEAVLARRKAANARRLYTVQIPAIRAAGFAILCLIAVLQGLQRPAPFPQAELLALLALNLALRRARLAGAAPGPRPRPAGWT